MNSLIEIEFHTNNLDSYAFISYLLETLTLKKDAIVEYKDGDVYNYCAFCELDEKLISNSKKLRVSKTVILDSHQIDISINKTIEEDKIDTNSVITLSLDENALLACFPNTHEIQKFIEYIVRRQFEMFKFTKCLINKDSNNKIEHFSCYVNENDEKLIRG